MQHAFSLHVHLRSHHDCEMVLRHVGNRFIRAAPQLKARGNSVPAAAARLQVTNTAPQLFQATHQCRYLATSTNTTKLHEDESQPFGTSSGDGSVEARYAEALFNVTRKKGNLENVWANLTSIQSLSKVIKDVSSGLKLTDEVTNFLLLLASNRRMNILEKSIDMFERMYREHRGELRCTITTATALTEEERAAVKAALNKRIPGKALVMHFTINRAVLGGLIAHCGERTIDLSLATRLHRLQQTLMAAI